MFLFLFINLSLGYLSLQHYLGSTTIGGKYIVKKDALAANYRGVTEDNFGTTTVVFDAAQANPVVRDMQYAVGNGVGFFPLPVSDGVPGGSKEVDDHLRNLQKLDPQDPIFAIIAYMHPEEHSGTMKQLATEMVKTESGQTHLGMYIGDGATRNSPETYHNKVWNVMQGNTGYPAIVQTLEYKGVNQGLLNRNMYIALTLLNNGVQFPNDYKNDQFRAINLKVVFQFYKDWLLGASYLRTDDTWKTYCAEHVTIVVNVGLNLPQNVEAYTAVYGADGANLYQMARDKFISIAGQDKLASIWDRDGGINFQPLYKKRLASPTDETFGKGLAWPAQANSDIMVSFLEAYASWPVVGAHVTISAAFGFRDTLVKRMSSSTDGAAHIGNNFDKLVGQASVLILVAEAMTIKNVDPAAHFPVAQVKIYAALGGNPAAVDQADPRFKIAASLVAGTAPFHAKIKAGPTLSKADAYKWFRKELAPILKGARDLALYQTDNLEKLVRFNSPPAITHRIAIGAWPSDPDVIIREVCTAINAQHLREKTPEEVARYKAVASPRPSTSTSSSGMNCRLAENKEHIDCMSLRALALECQRRQLVPCNGSKAALKKKVQDARASNPSLPSNFAGGVAGQILNAPRA